MTSLKQSVVLSLSLFVSAGCPGSLPSEPPDAGGGGTTGAGGTGGGGTGGEIASSCPNAMDVIATYCLDCHISPPQPIYANLDLEAPNPEQRLVGVPAYTGASGTCPGQGNLLNRGTLPATGIFIDKINFTQSCGSGMPYLGSKMSDADIACLQDWANGLVMLVGP